MKMDKRKQEPIFSKFLDIHEYPPPSTPSQNPLDQNNWSTSVYEVPTEDVFDFWGHLKDRISKEKGS
jgi:hypothetical protein